jgi:hypothetical protein
MIYMCMWLTFSMWIRKLEGNRQTILQDPSLTERDWHERPNNYRICGFSFPFALFHSACYGCSSSLRIHWMDVGVTSSSISELSKGRETRQVMFWPTFQSIHDSKYSFARNANHKTSGDSWRERIALHSCCVCSFPVITVGFAADINLHLSLLDNFVWMCLWFMFCFLTMNMKCFEHHT